jgi:hypothetical protein
MAAALDHGVEELAAELRAKFGEKADTEAQCRIAAAIDSGDTDATMIWFDVWAKLTPVKLW